MSLLPIYAVLEQLQQTLLIANNVVLIAPPGAGKTTVVPLELINEPWLNGKKIIMLEPRRLAAKNAAVWMSHQLSEPVGHTIGYRMRLDNRVSAKTKIEVVTEAVLTRIIQNDPELSAYGLIIFDEFHERHLQADLGLTLCLDIQANLRDDLKLLVMSATLEAEAVSTILGDALVIKSEGRSFPVDIHYLPSSHKQKLEQTVVKSILYAIEVHAGSILVFLPGVREIKTVETILLNAGLKDNISVCPLYGNLSQEEQEKAISPTILDKRKIVLATSIAESSLTIEGVTIVIDSGLMRVPRYNPRSEMTKLETLPVSLASADQRAGRAGRLSAGICYRLWSKDKHQGLIAQSQPEILQTDLVPLVLELSHWGVVDINELSWMNTPPSSAINVAHSILHKLGALDEIHRITSHGKQILKSGIHPRLGHMIINAQENKLGQVACDIAAILTEKDFIRSTPQMPVNSNLRIRLELLRNNDSGNLINIDRVALKRIKVSSNLLRKQTACDDSQSYSSDCYGLLLALAYPDRIAKRRANEYNRYLMSNGKAAFLSEADELSLSEYIVIANLDGNNKDSKIYLAAEITENQIYEYFSDLITVETRVSWNNKESIVKTVQQEKLGALVLREKPIPSPSLEQISDALIIGIREKGISQLPWNKTSTSLRHRIEFIRHQFPNDNWPDLSDKHLSDTLEEWLKPMVAGKTKLNQIGENVIYEAINNLLDWNKNQQLTKLAPTHITVPSGSRIPIDYSNIESPILSVRLQELFGLTESPSIAGGKIPLLIHLLSPARRPIQITKDLVSFWENTYEQVKKDLKGKYPKHYWPDNPYQAVATNRTKPKKR